MERRLLKGIAKRWEQQLQKKTAQSQMPEVRPLALHPTELAQQSTTRHRAKLLSATTGGHSNYAKFLAPHARLKRPLEPPRSQGEGSVYSRVLPRCERELPLVAAEVAKTPRKSARRS